MGTDALGILCALGSAAAWALGAILYKKLGRSVSASGLNLVKGLISLPVLAAALFVVGYEPVATTPFFLLALSGILGIAVGDTLFFLALQHLSAHALVLLCTTGQVMTVLMAVVFLGEAPTLTVWVGIALVILGVSVVLHARTQSAAEDSGALGILLGLLSVLCMSVAVVIAKKAIDSVSATQATFLRIAWGTAGLAVYGLVRSQLRTWVRPFAELELLRGTVFAVCVSTLSGFWLFHAALKLTDVSIANTLSSMEPLFVLPLAAFFLKETISRAAVAGAFITVGGLVFICL